MNWLNVLSIPHEVSHSLDGKEVNIVDQNKNARPRGTDAAKVIQVIQTEALEGSGTKDDPFRIQRRLWSLDGKLLAEVAQSD